MEELLELLCYEKGEMKREIPRIKKAFERLSITEADIANAINRLQYYEIDLLGFRGILGIYLREMVNLMLAREEKRKLIYNTFPSVSAAIPEAAMIADETVYAGFPAVLFEFVYGGIFDKMNPVFEKSERDVLPLGESHCGCNLTKLGMMLDDLLPKPDLQISWGVFCDEAPKVDDYLNAEYGIPLVTVNRIQDINFDDPEPDSEIQFCAAELRDTLSKVSELIGREITDEMLWQPLIEGRTYMQTSEEIMNLLINSDPVPLGLGTLWHIFLLYITNVSRENKARLQNAIETILRELREKVARGEGYYQKGAPRVAALISSFVDPFFQKLIKDLGLATVIMEPVWWFPDASITPDLGVEQELDPCRVLAKAMLKSSLIGCFPLRISATQEAMERYNIDGFLGVFPYSCRPYAADVLAMKDAIKKVKDIPVTIMEGDIWDARRYSSEALRTRMESFAEMCKISQMRKNMKAA